MRFIFVIFLALSAAAQPKLYLADPPDSLSHEIRTNFTARITGDPEVRRPMFSYRSFAKTNYIRNPNFAFADVPGIEAYGAGNNSAQNGVMNGILISPRHILSVSHTGSQVGQVIYFVNRTNNNVVARQVIDSEKVRGFDQTMAVLSEPISRSEILPAAVLDGMPYDLLPQYTNNLYQPIPVLACNQFGKPGIQSLGPIGPVIFNTTLLSSFPGWQYTVIVGDSGSPCLTVISNRIVVIGNWTTVNAGFFTWKLVPDVQAAMDALCARHSFTNETLEVINWKPK